MKAYIVETANGPFHEVDLPMPSPMAGQVLVRIKASGINPLDTKIRAGQGGHARQPLPAVLGLDMAGIVDAVHASVIGFQQGDEVYGFVGGVGGNQGTLAEFAAVDAALLAVKPLTLSMRQAAVMPLVIITAWEGLVWCSRKKSFVPKRRMCVAHHPIAGRAGETGMSPIDWVQVELGIQ